MFTLALYLRLFGHVPFLRWACKSPIEFFSQLCPRSNDYIKPLIWAHNWFSLSVSYSNILEGLNTSESYCHCTSLSLYMTWLYGKSLMFKESEIPKKYFLSWHYSLVAWFLGWHNNLAWPKMQDVPLWT